MTDVRGVDLSRYRFDTDLTLAALLMHPDGTVYHRYGARDHRSAGVWLSEPSLALVLRETLAEHEAYARAPAPPQATEHAPPLFVEEQPAFEKKDKGQCIHCHNVRSALYAEAAESGAFRDEDAWVWPPPGRVGLDLDTDDQRRITAVEPDSPAAAAGLEPGDLLLALGGRRILTASDVTFVLEETPRAGATLALAYRRAEEEHTGELVLPPDWRIGTPLEFSWRPFKWDLVPKVGFGGEDLSAEEKEDRGLAPDAFAFLVTYIVDWGENKRFGRAVQKAGIEKRDVVVAVAGRRDFAGEAHFQAWWRLEREPGDAVEVELLRDGETRTARIVIPN